MFRNLVGAYVVRHFQCFCVIPGQSGEVGLVKAIQTAPRAPLQSQRTAKAPDYSRLRAHVLSPSHSVCIILFTL